MLYLFNYLRNQKKDDRGFTLIELLVVIIIIGILSAVALPAFLNQSNKARQSEGRIYLSSIVRAQQGYLSEKKRFACSGEVLVLGIADSTPNYRYDIDCGVGNGLNNVTNQAIPLSVTKAYLGGVNIADNLETIVTVCEALLPIISGGASGAETFTFVGNNAPTCPAQYTNLNP